MTALQDEVLHWGPNFFSQNGAQPLVYVVVLLMSQHFRHAVEYMGSQTQLKDHGTHLAIACNHLKVGLECCILCCVDEHSHIRLNRAGHLVMAITSWLLI